MAGRAFTCLAKTMDLIVFLAAAVTVGILSYEGLTGMEYGKVLSAAVTVMDNAFLISVIMHFIKREGSMVLVCFNLINTGLLVLAYLLLFIKIEYAPWMLLFWDMYLLIYYGYKTTLIIQEKRGEKENGSSDQKVEKE
ncbi:MAG TPA: hypothetical protein PLU43_03820 [Lachnospiraceae bacterium]|nr:hypothetical protein [Lachnospiraceae bacterium]